MALKCFLPCVFQNVWPLDSHNYALQSVVTHTKVVICRINRLLLSALWVCGIRCKGCLWSVCNNVPKEPETSRQLTCNADISDIETKGRFALTSPLNLYTAQMTEHKLCVSLLCLQTEFALSLNYRSVVHLPGMSQPKLRCWRLKRFN